MLHSSQLTTSSNASKTTNYGELLEELGQEASDNDFHMRQCKAESIQDYIFSVKKFSLLLCKGHNH